MVPWPSDSGEQMVKCTKRQNRAAENGVAVENTGGAAPAHPNGVAARERNDAAGDRGGDGGFAEHREPRAHGLRPGRHQSAQAEAMRRTGSART